MKQTGLLALICAVWISHATAQTPYFQGKTIRVIVGYPAGSAHDLWARLIAAQLPKHVPGNPATIVQNMTGAGSMVATNYIHNVAKPDGLTLGVINAALYFDQLQKKKEAQFDWPKLSWIGSAPTIGSPGIPAEIVKILRAGYAKALASPELIAEARKRGFEPELIPGEELEALAKEVLSQPADVIASLKKVIAE